MIYDLEKMFLDKDIFANEDYITDGFIIICKKFMKKKIFRNFINEPNMVTVAVNKIPYEKGEEINLTQCGTVCHLLENEKVGIVLDEKNYLDYSFLTMVYDYFYMGGVYYTMINHLGGKLIKFFNDNDEFLGAVMSRVKCKED